MINPFLWLIGREKDYSFSSNGETIIFENEKEKSPIVLMDRKPKKYNYRPQTLDEYIGQAKAKEKVRLNLEKIEKYKKVHFIISGSAGNGKTTLAYVIANHLNAKVDYTVAGSFTIDTLQKFIEENNADKDRLHILFIDEVHSIDRNLAELLYPLLEDFQMPFTKETSQHKLPYDIDFNTGKIRLNTGSIKKEPIDTSVKPFVFIGATTDKDELFRKVAPLIDRCGCQIELEDYIVEDLAVILKQYVYQVYTETLDDKIYDTIARNCKHTPRIAIALMDDFIVARNLDKVFSASRIIKDGLTETDVKILKRLEEAKDRPIGEQGLAMSVGLAKRQYITLYEPFLLKQNYIQRTGRGRILAIKGKQILEELK